MTEITDVEMGDDLKALGNHPDVFNESTTKFTELNDNAIYLIKKYVGYMKSKDRSGIIIFDIQEVTEQLIADMIW